MMSSTTPLHAAASTGSVEQAISLLKHGTADIDRLCGEDRWTPLMIAAEEGFLRIIRVLLRFGADVSASNEHGHTALHISIRNQHLAVTKALIKAGADLEAKTDFFPCMLEEYQGYTPLHIAAGEGFCEGIATLLDAGAKMDSQMSTGSTPMYLAACRGKLEAVKVFVRVKAKRRLGACEGDLEALEASAHMNHERIVALLCDFGVKDTVGMAMFAAIDGRAEACVKLLAKRRGGHVNLTSREYMNIDKCNSSFLLGTFELGRYHAPRIARILLDHGADTTSKFPFELGKWTELSDTPLGAASMTLRHAETKGDVSKKALDGLKGVIRLLHQAEAVHALSWCWPGPRKDRGTSIVRKLSVMRRAAGRPAMLAAAISRYSLKQDPST